MDVRVTGAGYESGMKVTYDASTKRVVVAFRGRITVLPQTFETEAAGLAEGEAYCRRHGWLPADKSSRNRTLRSAW